MRILIFIITLFIISPLHADVLNKNSDFKFSGKCPICIKQNKKSCVYVNYTTTTLLNCGNGYYDEDGNFKPPSPCNTVTTYYSCSNGHSFTNTGFDIDNGVTIESVEALTVQEEDILEDDLIDWVEYYHNSNRYDFSDY